MGNIYFDVKDNPAKVRCADSEILTACTWRPNSFSRSDSFADLYPGPMWRVWIRRLADIFYRWAHFNFFWFLIGNSATLLTKDVASLDTVKHFNHRNIEVVF